MSRIPERIKDIDSSSFIAHEVDDSSGKVDARDESPKPKNLKPKESLRKLHEFIEKSRVDNPDSDLETEALDLSLVKVAKKISDEHYWDLNKLRKFANYNSRMEGLTKSGLLAAYENLQKNELTPLCLIRHEIDQVLRLSGFTKIGKDLKKAGEFFEKELSELRQKSENFHNEVRYLAKKKIRLSSYRNPYESELLNIETVKNVTFKEACALFEKLSSAFESALKIIDDAHKIDLSVELDDLGENLKDYPSDSSLAVMKAFYLAQTISAEFKHS